MKNNIFNASSQDPKSCEALVRDVVFSFKNIVTKISHYRTLLLWISEIIKENGNQTQLSKMTSDGVYKFVKRYFISSPFEKADPRELLDIYDQSFRNGNLNDQDNITQKKELEVSKIQALALISCYLGNRNPENTDKRLFKDYKKRSKVRKTTKKEEVKKVKPLKFNRFLALTQALMSITVDKSRETQMFHHSMEFYAEINSLVDMEYITKILPQNNTFSKMKYVCNLEMDTIKELCMPLELRLVDFLYEGA